jgi:hypothetical protein
MNYPVNRKRPGSRHHGGAADDPGQPGLLGLLGLPCPVNEGDELVGTN